MRKLSFIIIAITMLSIQLFPQDCDAKEQIYKEGYKNAKWGMTKEEVKKSFPDMTFQKSGNMIYFLSKIAGDDVSIGFDFVKNKLYGVFIVISVDTSNDKIYISKFNKFEELLIKKYGEPEDKMRKGSSNQFIDDATAISIGKGGYLDSWTTPESTIDLSLMGDNYKLTLMIGYKNKELYKEKEEIDEGKSLDEL